jgi:hypothetical protein
MWASGVLPVNEHIGTRNTMKTSRDSRSPYVPAGHHDLVEHADILLLGDGQPIRVELDAKFLDVGVLKEMLAAARAAARMPPAQSTIAVVPVDPRGSTRPFLAKLESRGVKVLPVPFFWALPLSLKSAPPELRPLPQRYAGAANYVLGMLAGRAEAGGRSASCAVFGTDFGLAVPAIDFQARSHEFVLVFPRGLLDERWLTEIGLNTLNSGQTPASTGTIPFWDMTDQLSRFVGGSVPTPGWSDSTGIRVPI